MSAALAVSVNSPNFTSWPVTAPGSAVRIDSPSLSSVSSMSVHNEEARAARGVRTVRVGAVRDLIAHARLEHEGAAVLELGRQLARDTEKDVALLAPVIGRVARRIVAHPPADVAELPRTLFGRVGVALVLRRCVCVFVGCSVC